MKRIIALILTIAILLSMAFSVYADDTILYSGSCGTNLTWTLDDAGVLTIEGTGQMEDYSLKSAPWDTYMNMIKFVQIGNGTTTISDNAFDNFSEIETVTLSNTVTTIGHSSFDKCTKLARITIPEGVITIGNATFRECTALISVTIPNTVTSMGTRVFEDCRTLSLVSLGNGLRCIDKWCFKDCVSLEKIAIPNGVDEIGAEAFRNCQSLTSVIISSSVDSIGNRGFYNCDSLEKVYFKGSRSKQINLFSYQVAGNNASRVEIIYSYIPATQIELNKTAIELRPGNTTQLTAMITPSNATYNYVVWSSSNTDVATVTSDGLVEALGEGYATIYAITVDGFLSNNCEINVIPDYSITERAEISVLNKNTNKISIASAIDISSACVIVAIYQSKVLLDVKSAAVNIEAGENIIDSPITDYQSADTVNVLLWERINGLKPLAEKFEMSIK